MFLETDSLYFRYPKSKDWAVEDFSLSIQNGTILGLLGPNGAGKTTLIRLLISRLQAAKGSIRYSEGFSPQSTPEQFAVLIENPGLYPKYTVEEYLAFFGSLYKKQIEFSIPEKIQELCEELDLPPKQRLEKLSLGMKQKLQIARCFITNPRFVLLDEPSANLDHEARSHLWNLIREYNKTKGTTFIICSHVLGELEEHCSHFAFLKKGRLLEYGEREDLRKKHSAATTVQILGQNLDAAWNQLENKTEITITADCISNQELRFTSNSPNEDTDRFIKALHNLHCEATIHQCIHHSPRISDLYEKILNREAGE